MTMTKSELVHSAYAEVFSIIRKNLTQVWNGKTITITGSFPDQDISDGKLDYPVLTIDTPLVTSLDTQGMGNGVTEANIHIVSTVFSTKAEEASQIADEVIDILDTKKGTLETNELFLGDPAIEGMSQDQVMHANTQTQVHTVTVPANFKYDYVRS